MVVSGCRIYGSNGTPGVCVREKMEIVDEVNILKFKEWHPS